MRNSKGSFYRTDEISREPRHRADWLEQFAEKMGVEEVVTKKVIPDPEPKVKTAASKSAVEVARDRQQGPSVFEMMSSIVSAQKPKYSSVEEAVQDYQRRAGLKPVDKLAELAKQVVQASEEEVGPDTDDVKFVPRPPPFVPEKWEENNTFGFFAKYLEGLAKSKDPADRMRAATNYLASEETLLELSEDELEDIRGAAKKTLSEKEDNRFTNLLSDLESKDDNERCSDTADVEEGLIRDIVGDMEGWIGEEQAMRRSEREMQSVPEQELSRLAKSTDPQDRVRAAKDPRTPKQILLELMGDKLMGVRLSARKTLRELGETPEESDTADVRWDSKKKSLVAESDSNNADDDVADLITQHPAIETFVKNLIDTNPGIQVPAVLYAITETFGRDGVDQHIFGDKQLSKWINKQLMNKNYLQDETTSQLGRGVGISVDYAGPDDGNRNPFLGLTPNRGTF